MSKLEEMSTFEEDDVRKEITFEDSALGRVQLRTKSGDIILVPKPSNDPSDPLNWSQPFKYYVAILACFGMLMCQFLAAGPAVALLQIAADFSNGNRNIAEVIPQVAFFFTVPVLTQGLGTMIWQPLIRKYGRRPVYIFSFSGYLATAIWSGMSTGFDSELTARALLGFFSGAGEVLGPATIGDIFFLHERGSVIALYNFAVGSGVSIGIIASGFIVASHSWRVIYWVGSGLIGFTLILIVFTFPETAYNRSYNNSEEGDIYHDPKKPYRLSLSIVLDDEKARLDRWYREQDKLSSDTESIELTVIQNMEERLRRLEAAVLGNQQYTALSTIKSSKNSYWTTLSFRTGQIYTKSTLFQMFTRPFGLIVLPPVLWATVVMSTLIGLAIALASTFANDFARVYNFTPFQSGLAFIGSLVGGILAIPAGGPLGEAIANYFTLRNKGIREPEFRLPALTVSMVMSPLGLVLYGIGMEKVLAWWVPVIGIGLTTFSVGQGINISFVYTLDAYEKLRGEVTITQLAFKSVIGFALSAATNTWIASSGELLALSEMAAISFAILSLWIPMFFYGSRLRRWSLGWRIVRFIHWQKED